jgi:hypothetical protein
MNRHTGILLPILHLSILLFPVINRANAESSPDFSLQLRGEKWFSHGDLEEYWISKGGEAIEFSVSYLPRIDLSASLSFQSFDRTADGIDLGVPDLWMLVLTGGLHGSVVKVNIISAFLDGGLLWAITGFSGGCTVIHEHSARESEGGVYLGGGFDINLHESWILQPSCRYHRLFSNPEPIDWFSVGIGLRHVWRGFGPVKGLWS